MELPLKLSKRKILGSLVVTPRMGSNVDLENVLNFRDVGKTVNDFLGTRYWTFSLSFIRNYKNAIKDNR